MTKQEFKFMIKQVLKLEKTYNSKTKTVTIELVLIKDNPYDDNIEKDEVIDYVDLNASDFV